MSRREVEVNVSDHAVLRFLERQFALDVAAIKRHICGLTRNGAELGAIGIQVGRVKFVCRDAPALEPQAMQRVVVVTALDRSNTITRPHDD